jgi:hypothetical protein
MNKQELLARRDYFNMVHGVSRTRFTGLDSCRHIFQTLT